MNIYYILIYTKYNNQIDLISTTIPNSPSLVPNANIFLSFDNSTVEIPAIVSKFYVNLISYLTPRNGVVTYTIRLLSLVGIIYFYN